MDFLALVPTGPLKQWTLPQWIFATGLIFFFFALRFVLEMWIGNRSSWLVGIVLISITILRVRLGSGGKRHVPLAGEHNRPSDEQHHLLHAPLHKSQRGRRFPRRYGTPNHDAVETPLSTTLDDTAGQGMRRRHAQEATTSAVARPWGWQEPELADDGWEIDLPRRIPSGIVRRDRPRRPYTGRTPPQRARVRRSLREKQAPSVEHEQNANAEDRVSPVHDSLEHPMDRDSTVDQLLTDEGLPQYIGVFAEEALHSVSFLCDVVERSPDRLRSMLNEIGVSRVGHRERILLAVERVLQRSREPRQENAAALASD